METDHKELERLSNLNEFDILGTDSEKEFDDIAQLAADLCDAPVSMINFIGKNRQWSKSMVGLPESFKEIPRDQSVCQYAIKQTEILEIHDLSHDERTNNHPYVKDSPMLKHYCGAPLISSNGHAIGAICVLDYKERELSKKQKKQLGVLANEVMARLELKKKNRILEELSSYKTDLMKMLSHDLRSPLNGILGMSNMITSTNMVEDEEVLEMVHIIEQSAYQLNQMIDEVMSYSIMESKGFSLNPEKTDLNEVVQNMENLFSPAAKSKQIRLLFKTDKIDQPIYVDKRKVEQLFGNLLSNAIKFTEKEGEVIASLSVKNENGEKELKIVVSDTGIGMDEMAINRLDNSMEADESYQNRGTDGEKSTGLGLSIIKHFVDLHQGTIQVESEKGKGTTFIITIPEVHN